MLLLVLGVGPFGRCCLGSGVHVHSLCLWGTRGAGCGFGVLLGLPLIVACVSTLVGVCPCAGGPLPELFSVHHGKVVRVKEFGAFVEVRSHG